MARTKTAEIYRITNLMTGRQYIGSTTAGYGTRWRNHRSHMRVGQHPSKTMTADFFEFGVESFTIELLEEVPDPSTLEAREWEIVSQALADGIHLYNTWQPITCQRCGRRFMGKTGRRTCSQPTYSCLQ